MTGSLVPDSVDVLTVCMGNVCRSPLAEQLLRVRLSDLTGVGFGSAGLDAAVGMVMDEESARWSRHHGGDPSGAVATQLTQEHAARAGLVLTMTLAQREELVRRYPAALLRTFTLVEFSRVLPTAVPAEGVAGAADLVRAVRSCAQHRHRADLRPEDDIQDPIGAGAEVHERVALQIVEAVEKISGAVHGR